MTTPKDMTTRLRNISLTVDDLDAAVRWYTEVLGCELSYDAEVMPGERLVEVVPPGSQIGIVLLPRGTRLPIAVRLGTADVDAAHARLRESGARLDNDEVLRWEGVEPMFAFHDPWGNQLVYLEDPRDSGGK